MRLTVTRRSHTHRGKTYFPGDEFDGTKKLMLANPDRLAPVAEAVTETPEAPARKRKRKGSDNADTSNSG